MDRQLILARSFERALRRLIRSRRVDDHVVQDVLQRLAADFMDPTLHSHRLRGRLRGTFACKVGYDMRIIFEPADVQGVPSILLHSIGKHDEVY